ncbi:hypothetical protein HYC85_025543 [Camellia sinensis]|uniref:Uncharacterized protein n=1 Tax=Camellia sinensis TaxID=4442 RepID=A0A7J7GBU6_CAMSI|nr:hypothetical protein HYC85_025543 [Camellia sinensis]
MKTWKSGHGARSDGLGQLLDLDKARTTVSGNGEAAVVAESGNFDADDLAGLQNGHPLWDFYSHPRTPRSRLPGLEKWTLAPLTGVRFWRSSSGGWGSVAASGFWSSAVETMRFETQSSRS